MIFIIMSSQGLQFLMKIPLGADTNCLQRYLEVYASNGTTET